MYISLKLKHFIFPLSALLIQNENNSKINDALVSFLKEAQNRPYWAEYPRWRSCLHDLIISKYFDLIIAGLIGLNIICMATEFYLMPPVRILSIHFYCWSQWNLQLKFHYTQLQLLQFSASIFISHLQEFAVAMFHLI